MFMAIPQLPKMAPSSDEQNVDSINKKAESLLQNKQNANLIIELLQTVMTGDESTCIAAMNALEKVFTSFLIKGEMAFDSSSEKTNLEVYSLEEKYKIWLQEQYEETKLILILHLNHKNRIVQELALSALMHLYLIENDNPINKAKNGPVDFLKAIVEGLLSEDKNMNVLIKNMKQFTQNTTVAFFLLKILHSQLKSKDKEEASTKYLENAFALLTAVNFTNTKPKSKKKDKTVTDTTDEVELTTGELPAGVQKKFSIAWLEFLKFKLPINLYKKVLVILHDEVMPFIPNPLLLTDFLTDSYNIGGVISLLALNGLFYLIRLYNLEYPDFYKKLYALLTDVIFTAKYRARFFYLTDLFLSSSHLPAYLVASFAKRLGRLCLIAPVDTLFILIPFIGNLLIRHPSLNVLIKRGEPIEVKEDPYLANETDPSLSNALGSSLWELKSLQNHWHPDIAAKAKFINKNLPVMEWDLSEVLETNYQDIFDYELDSNLEEVHLTLDNPKDLLNSLSQDSVMKMIWSTS